MRRHTTGIQHLAEPELRRLKEQFFIEPSETEPRVFMRLTDNWIQLSVRFLCRTHDIRVLKDAISRDMLAGFEAAGIGIASSTYDVVGFPPIRLEPPILDSTIRNSILQPPNASAPTKSDPQKTT